MPYYYRPLFVCATCEKKIVLTKQNQIISSCYKNNVCIDRDKLIRACRQRLRIISMASENKNNCPTSSAKFLCKTTLLSIVGMEDCLIILQERRSVIFNRSSGCFKNLDIDPVKFTAKENMNERMQLIESFNRGDITVLVAIRCLDEGLIFLRLKER